MLETCKDLDPQSREILQTRLYGGGKFVPSTIQTSVKFRDIGDPNLCKFPTFNCRSEQIY